MNSPDIVSVADVKKLIDAFYRKVIVDPVIGFIFTDVISLNWEVHIPVMYSFWNSILLGSNSYAGNPMLKHIELNQKVSITKDHFNRWLELWETTVNENFSGKKAIEAISRAKNIAALMEHKIRESHPAP